MRAASQTQPGLRTVGFAKCTVNSKRRNTLALRMRFERSPVRRQMSGRDGIGILAVDSGGTDKWPIRTTIAAETQEASHRREIRTARARAVNLPAHPARRVHRQDRQDRDRRGRAAPIAGIRATKELEVRRPRMKDSKPAHRAASLVPAPGRAVARARRAAAADMAQPGPRAAVVETAAGAAPRRRATAIPAIKDSARRATRTPAWAARRIVRAPAV
jgi:hypothetical protein